MIKFTQINDTDGHYEYLTVEECIRRNGHRHLENAIAYASAGYPDRYYKGSMKKALKQYAKAELFKTPEWMIRAYGHKLVEMADKIGDEIMYGTGYYLDGKRVDVENVFVDNPLNKIGHVKGLLEK